MICLFIFKSNSRGMQYGIGTYIRELTDALLKYTDINLFLVNYKNNECNEFSIETISSRYFRINIPAPLHSSVQNNLYEKRYASSVVNLLSDLIPKKGKVIFQMNYIDDLPIIKKLKETYTHPVISVVHFAQWQQIFLSNKQKLRGLNIDVPSNNIEFTLAREKEMYMLSDHIISVTRYMKEFLVEEYSINPDKIDIVPNGLDFRRFQTVSQEEKIKLKYKLGFSPNEKLIIFSGRVDPCKGIFFLIDAFMEAYKYQDNLRLVIIGQGDIQDCLKRTDSYFGKITYTGFIPLDKVMEFYKIADVGVISSIYDHCPYTVLEMMSQKIPLILSRINGLDEMLNESQCLFINPVISTDGEMSFDIKAIAEAILSITSDEERVKAITCDYAEIIRTRFAAQRMAIEMQSVLKSLCVTVEI